MSNKNLSRRSAISKTLMGSAAAMAGFGFKSTNGYQQLKRAVARSQKLPMRVSLNTSTLLHYDIAVDKQIEMVANAGFDGVELWMRNIKAFLDNGGSAAHLKEKLEAKELLLENIIGFSKWCSDKPEDRKEALAQLREEMEITAALGGKFIAAPVQGIAALDRTKYDDYAERYNAILELGDETAVTPVLELWGMGALHKIADCAQIVIATGHPKATMLLDFYHIHRGGNDWDTLDCLNGRRLPVIHMNDFPASPSWEQLTDADRVLPGEGVCPFDSVIPKLYDAGFRGGLSVELFNKGYWASMDAETLLKKSYETTYEVVSKSLAGKI